MTGLPVGNGQSENSVAKVPETPVVPDDFGLNTEAAKVELLREALIALPERKAASIKIAHSVDLTNLDPEQKLDAIISNLKEQPSPDSARPQIIDIHVLSNMSGLGETGLSNTTHLVLLKLRDAEPILAVLKIAGGVSGAMSGMGGFNLLEGAFETLCTRLKENRPELPRLYVETKNPATDATEGIIYEFIPGPDLEAALMNGLVSWDTGFDLVLNSLNGFAADGLATWDRVACNFIVSGFTIDPESVSSCKPKGWCWIRDPSQEQELTLIDTDSLGEVSGLTVEVEDCVQGAEEMLQAGVRCCPSVEQAIGSGILKPESFAALIDEYIQYLGRRGFLLKQQEMENHQLKLVPRCDGTGEMIRGGTVTFQKYSDKPLPSYADISNAMLRYFQDLYASAVAVGAGS